jgi:hypothetical protein
MSSGLPLLGKLDNKKRVLEKHKKEKQEGHGNGGGGTGSTLDLQPCTWSINKHWSWVSSLVVRAHA